MSKVMAIFRRELFVYFFSPLAYVFTMAFVLATGWAFYLVAAMLNSAGILPRAPTRVRRSGIGFPHQCASTLCQRGPHFY